MTCGDSFGTRRFHALTGGRGLPRTGHFEAARRPSRPGVSVARTNSPDEDAISRPGVELVPAVGSVTGLFGPHRAGDGRRRPGMAPNPPPKPRSELLRLRRCRWPGLGGLCPRPLAVQRQVRQGAEIPKSIANCFNVELSGSDAPIPCMDSQATSACQPLNRIRARLGQ